MPSPNAWESFREGRGGVMAACSGLRCWCCRPVSGEALTVSPEGDQFFAVSFLGSKYVSQGTGLGSSSSCK